MAQDIHAIALEAEKAAELLATTLAHEGASEDVTKQVTACADVFRQLVEALGRGQEETADNEPAGPGGMDQAVAETQEAAQSAAAKRSA